MIGPRAAPAKFFRFCVLPPNKIGKWKSRDVCASCASVKTRVRYLGADKRDKLTQSELSKCSPLLALSHCLSRNHSIPFRSCEILDLCYIATRERESAEQFDWQCPNNYLTSRKMIIFVYFILFLFLSVVVRAVFFLRQLSTADVRTSERP